MEINVSSLEDDVSQSEDYIADETNRLLGQSLYEGTISKSESYHGYKAWQEKILDKDEDLSKELYFPVYEPNNCKICYNGLVEVVKESERIPKKSERCPEAGNIDSPRLYVPTKVLELDVGPR